MSAPPSADDAPLAVAVSPHLDDAAFSAGGLLARLVDHGWRVEVVTALARREARLTAGGALRAAEVLAGAAPGPAGPAGAPPAGFEPAANRLEVCRSIH